MTAEHEFKGRNVQKALETAAKALGVSAEALRYDILSHGSTGIFGLAGIKKARIKVYHDIPPAVPADLDHQEDSAVYPADNEANERASDNDQDMVLAVGEGVLRRMVEAISPESTISISRHQGRIKFSIEGGQSGILIGKRGQTLEAMQLILDKTVRRLNGQPVRLEVDVEGYLAKKKAGLVRTAERIAQKVKTKGRPGSIGYLNAQDRRIVHLALKHNPGVRTKSVGEGSVRKLMIYPRNKNRTKTQT